MKKITLTDGSTAYSHDYKDYNILIGLNEEENINSFTITHNNELIASGDIYDDKFPNGTPNTSHYRKKIQTEIEELLDQDVIGIQEEVKGEE